MKCPKCGQWNRASIPKCMRCGALLINAQPNSEPDWKNTLRDGQKSAAYYRMDEYGESDATSDARDVLANEMQEFKARKEEGQRQQRKLRTKSAQRGSAPSGMGVQIHISDDPMLFTGSSARRLRSKIPVSEAGSKTTVFHQNIDNEYINDSNENEPLWAEQEQYGTRWQVPQTREMTGLLPERTRRVRKFLRFLIFLLIIVLLALVGFFGYHYFQQRHETELENNRASVIASIVNDLAAHTIKIPGKDGSQIYIRELHTSYIVADGFATIEIPDHVWYDDVEDYLNEQMEVSLTPYLKTASGKQQPLEVISYTIDIPLSPIEMTSPDSLRTDVSSTMYSMSFVVRPGSRVFVNDTEVSDTVNSETGEFSYNATVQPIGDNLFTIRCRSQYCRENQLNVVLYREPQEIPLDLAADTYTSYNEEYMKISCTTLPGATVSIESPFSDMNITSLATTGAFSFYAHFDHIGTNTVKIRASYPGKKDSVINYNVYYLPPASTYTPKAWPLSEAGYAELVSNISYRAEHTQVYVVIGHLQYFVSEKPQMAVFYTSDDEKSRPVLLENYTNRNWELGTFYRIYADAYSTYNGMPWLCARYTYLN